MSLGQLQEQEVLCSDRIVAFGDAAWTGLRKHSIAPTPRNYELLFAHFSGLNPSLSERLTPFLEHGRVLTADHAEAIHNACLGADASADAVEAGAEDIAEVAQTLVEQVSNNQEALRSYGDVLTRAAGHIAAPTSLDDLVKVVATLSAETGRAAERNRTLERQLAASTVRIAKLRQDLVAVRQESTTDKLTGIANRKAFDAKLRRALAAAKADASAAFSLILLDVDHFKRFNDAHGHRTGDQVLRLFGRLLSDNVKGRDTPARYGGEEFAVLLIGADLRAGCAVAEQIRQRLAMQRLVKRGTGAAIGQITVSAGVAQHRPGENGASLIERADRALYEAKRSGRDRVCAAAENGEKPA